MKYIGEPRRRLGDAAGARRRARPSARGPDGFASESCSLSLSLFQYSGHAYFREEQ